ncbi:hypothetical protein C0584_04205 [Candidatus Parcubacteria bacterium]|nr:MAG: hypothetical protein C0584_04205 [Candidatus Parcubacteria bacterium]
MTFKKITNQYKGILENEGLRRYFNFSAFIFFVFFVLGMIFAKMNFAEAKELFLEISKKYEFAIDYNFWQLFVFIFNNNVMIAFSAFLSGIIFGIPTMIILITNSFVIGTVVMIATEDMDIFSIIFSLLPHGIFEIPAILLALSLGFLLGRLMYGYLFKKKRIDEKFSFLVKVFFYVVFPLLFIAAFVEAALISFFK